jgi:hypothetical protein
MWRRAVIVSAVEGALLLTQGSASAQDLGFVQDGPVDVGDDTVLTVVNDGGEPLSSVRVNAMLHPEPAVGSARVAVPVSVDFGDGFGVQAKGPLAPGEALQIELTTPKDAPRPAVGLVVVTARNPQGATVVARQELAIAADIAVPGVSTWSAVSRTWWKDSGGEVGQPIPLDAGSGCPEDEAVYEDHLAAGDRAVAVTLTCRDDSLTVTTGAYPVAGTYIGTVTVDDEEVDIEVRHTLAVWFVLLPILLGFLLAIIVQRRMAGSDTQLRWWLMRLRGRAALADQAFLEQSSNADWDRYRIEPVVATEGAELRRRLHDLRQGLPRWLRWLPWSPGEQEPERQAIVESINDLDRLVTDWPQTPRDIKRARERLAASADASSRSPLLVQRMAEVQAPEGELSVDELRSRREFLLHFDAALDVVDQLAVVDGLLRGVDRTPATEEWSPLDEEVYQRAKHLVREASVVLAQLRSSSEVEREVGPLVGRAARLVARLPIKPRRTGMRGATAGDTGIVESGLVLVRRVAEAVSRRGYTASQSALVLVALFVAVATGLALLYVGKAWGTPTDFLAAFVWGFGATALLSPVLDLLRGFGDRPTRAATDPAPGG